MSYYFYLRNERGFPGGTVVKNLPANAGDARDTGSISGLGRSPGVGNGNLLQYSCLEKSHQQWSLAGYSFWDHKKSNMTEHTHKDMRIDPETLPLIFP